MTSTSTSTSTSTATTSVATIDAYLEAYGEPDPARRAALIERSWAPDGLLVDPPLDPAAGHTALDETFAAVQAHFPGHAFRRTTVVDEHHGHARYGWEMVGPDGSVAMEGLDVADFADDGRLARVVGFLGALGAD